MSKQDNDIDLGKLQASFAKHKKSFDTAKKLLARAQRQYDDAMRLHMSSKTLLENAAKAVLNRQSL